MPTNAAGRHNGHCEQFENLTRRCHGGGNVVVGVGGTDKTGFIQGRGDVHAPVKQAVEQLVEAALSVVMTLA